jgi:flagellar basal-body rod modification protein FlgD
MATDPVSNPLNSASTSSTLSNAVLGNLKLDDFLKMLLTELQNQDPLSPMDSSQMLTQIGQISQVGATQNLTDTLNSVLMGQNINNAAVLIGKVVDGLDDSGTEIVGKVDSVSITDNKPVLNIGTDTMQLSNVKTVLPDTTATASATSSATAAALPAAAAAAATPAASTQSTQLQQLLQLLQQSPPATATTSTVQPTAATTS